MNPLSLLAQKLLAVAAVALLLAVIGLAIALQFAHAARDVAIAERDSAQQAVKAAETERDSYKLRAGELGLANGAWVEAFAVQGKAPNAAQGEVVRLQQEGRAAIAAAQAAAADADRTLKAFVARFATSSREPDCGRALIAMEAACPALSDY